MTPWKPARVVVVSFLGLAIFSTLFTLAAWYDWWPRLSPGTLHDSDLVAGILAGLLLLYGLIRAKAPEPETGRSGDTENS